jgi:hypothetical protein
MSSLQKRILNGFGMALVLAAPLWLTLSHPPNYLNFGISLVLGMLLLMYSRLS